EPALFNAHAGLCGSVVTPRQLRGDDHFRAVGTRAGDTLTHRTLVLVIESRIHQAIRAVDRRGDRGGACFAVQMIRSEPQRGKRETVVSGASGQCRHSRSPLSPANSVRAEWNDALPLHL